MRKLVGICLVLMVLFGCAEGGSDVEGGIESGGGLPFSYEVLEGYKEDLLSNGVCLKKWMEDGVCKDEEGEEYTCGYKVEIRALMNENLVGWEDVYDYVSDKYEGYSMDFGEDGVYVDEGYGGDAVRHYFVMRENGGDVFEAYIKVQSQYFGRHEGEFGEFGSGLKIF
ncbi:MAG: hypothetical protein V1679_03015 [Candidatus Peregrinibacteria bacterium]